MHTASRSGPAIVGFSPRLRGPLERARCDKPDVIDQGVYNGESKVSSS
jgi:hypothetical protein